MDRLTLKGCKEEAEIVRLVLQRNCHRLNDQDYTALYNFIVAAGKRLPHRETILKHLGRKAVSRS